MKLLSIVFCFVFNLLSLEEGHVSELHSAGMVYCAFWQLHANFPTYVALGSMPTPKHLSVSTSVLYHKRNTDFSSAGMLNISSRPESLVGKLDVHINFS